MSLSVDVDIDGVDDLLENFDELPEEFQREVAKGVNRTALQARTEAINTYDRNGTQNTGVLRSSISVRKKASVRDPTAILGAGGAKTEEGGFDYAFAIEFGTEPHFPPVEAVTGQTEALDRWVEVSGKVSVGPDEDRETVALNIARKISQVGTNPQPFMRPTAKVMAPKLESELSDVIDRLDL